MILGVRKFSLIGASILVRRHMSTDGRSSSVAIFQRNSVFLALAIYSACLFMTKADNDPCNEDGRLASRLGNSNLVTIIGLFDVHQGEQCEILRAGGFEQLSTALRWSSGDSPTTDDSSPVDFLAYDTCSDIQTAVKRLITGLGEAGVLSENYCKNTTAIGVIGPANKDIAYHVSHVLASLEIPYFPLSTTSLLPEIKALVATLAELKWKQIALFSANENLESQFYEEARHADICVSVSHILPKTSWFDSLLDASLEKIDETSTEVIVVLGSDHDVDHLFQSASPFNTSEFFWLFAGVSADNKDIGVLLEFQDPVILVQRTFSNFSNLMLKSKELLSASRDSDKYNKLLEDYNKVTGQCNPDSGIKPVSGNEVCHSRKKIPDPLLSATVRAVLSFKAHLDEIESLKDHGNQPASEMADHLRVGNESSTTELNSSSTQPTAPLQVSVSQEYEVKIWSYEQYTTGKATFPQPLEVGQYRLGRLKLNKKKLDILRSMGSGWYRIPEFHCRNKCDAVCLNKDNISSRLSSYGGSEYYLRFRNETWLTVILTVSCIGSLVALVLIAYLGARTCQREVIDSNQAFAIIALLAVIFAYSCTFLFALIAIQKTTRIILLGVAYATMFAPIIARCFVIIAAEMEGIPGHVSGLIQFVLCFFIAGVQFAVIVCYWLLSGGAWSTSRKTHIMGYLSYDIFLGLLWIVISPFCARSPRGYREGLLLHVASVSTLIVWILWVLMFFLLPTKWQDFVLCIGLVGTASMILLIVFLPRVYRMMTSVALDAAQVSLRPVILDVATAAGQTTSIYESVNHGYNADKDGFAIDMFKDTNDLQSNNRMTHL